MGRTYGRWPSLVGLVAVAPATAQSTSWIEFTDETSARLVAEPSVGAADVDEKAYAWGDVALDGDIDFIVVRKLSGTNPVGSRNVLEFGQTCP